MKKFLMSFLMVLILCLLPLEAEATTSGSCGTNMTWDLDTTSGVLTISGSGAMTDYGAGNPPWFDQKSSITSIVIEDGVQKIGTNAFRAFSNLTAVSIPDSVTSMGAYVFYSCTSLTSIHLPKNLATVPTYGFYNCSKLTEVILPENLVTIGTYAFSGCSALKQITIPHSTQNIYTGAFDNCSSLRTVYRYGSSSWTFSFPSSPTIKTMYLITYTLDGADYATEGVVSGGNAAFLQEPYEYFYGYYVDGVAWNGKNITQDCEVTVTQVPAYTVTYTGAYTGTDRVKSGTNATLPTPPDYYVYSFTSGGKTWTGENITKNVTVNVTQKATCGESLTWSISSGKLTISGSGPMYNFTESSPAPWYGDRASIKSLSLPTGLTTIGSMAFLDCTELTSVSLSSSKITSIGSWAFEGCKKLSSITLPSAITALPAGIFYNCYALKSVTLPATITSIGEYAFCGSGIESLVIPDGVTSIEDYTFRSCYDLKTITIPDSVAYMRESAFEYTSLTEVRISDLTSWLNIYFARPYGNSNPLAGGADLVVNGSTLTNLTIPESVTTVNAGAFYGCKSLKKVIVPSRVSSVERDAFRSCTNLTYASISSDSIGLQIFYECSGLSTVILDGQLSEIPENAFGYCTSLTSIDIPDTVTTIESGAFYGCEALERVTIPAQIKTVGNVAFQDCPSIERVYLNDLSSWMNADVGNYGSPFGSGAKLYLNGLSVTDLVIPDDALYVQNLYGCTGIKSVYLHRNIKNIYGMKDNTEIETVYAPVSRAMTGSFHAGAEFVLYCTVDYVKDGEAILSHEVYVGGDSELPQAPEGTRYYFEADGKEWDGKNVTYDATVSVYDGALITYTGDYVGTDVVKLGGNAPLPTEPSKLRMFEVDGKEWSGEQVTGNTTVEVIDLTPFEHNPNAGWSIKNKILRVGGTGTMPEYISQSNYPWRENKYPVVEVKIGDGIINIGAYAFDTFHNLETVTIGNSVITIGEEAFDDSTKIKSIVIPDSVTSIGAYAFEDCYALSSVTIGAGVETIGLCAFRYNETAEYVIDESNRYFKAVDGHIFSKDGTVLVRYAIAKEDTSYEIPEGVTTIASFAFESATKLESVIIPTSVTSIEDSAFWIVDSPLQGYYLSTAYYRGTVEQWNAIAIYGPHNEYLLKAKIVFHHGQEHVEEILPAEEVTCTKDGKTEGKHCSACGEVLLAQETISAPGHTEVIDAAKAPSCTEDGKTEGKHCSRCGEVLLAQQTIPANGHSCGEPIIRWEKNFGSVVATASCTCGETMEVRATPIWRSESGKLIAEASLQLGGKTVTEKLELTAVRSGSSVSICLPRQMVGVKVIAAAYSGQKQMTAVSSKTATAETVILPVTGEEIRLFLVGEKYSPCTPMLVLN